MTFTDFKSLQVLHPKVFERLLQDESTGKNIMWMNDNYRQVVDITDDGGGLLAGYYAPGKETNIYTDSFKDHITGDKVIRHNIRPRSEKSRQEQDKRCSDHDEVYTPAWQVSRQMNIVDDIWFDRMNNPDCGIFTVDGYKSYTVSTDKIKFPAGKTWKDYVKRSCIEPCEGEGAYVQTFRDARTGREIPIQERTGMFDRKMRVVNENCNDFTSWLTNAIDALRHVWGFEYQGDNLLIARFLLLLDFDDYFANRYPEQQRLDNYEHILYLAADTITINHIQMDGLSWTVPMTCSGSCQGCKDLEARLHDGKYARSFDWDKREWFYYRDLAKSRSAQKVNALF